MLTYKFRSRNQVSDETIRSSIKQGGIIKDGDTFSSLRVNCIWYSHG